MVNFSSKDLDLAIEAHSLLRGEANREIPGVTHETKEYDNTASVSIIKIINEEGAKIMGRPLGSYITLTVPSLPQNQTGRLIKPVSGILAEYLKELIPQHEQEKPILVVGLGNWQITPDALGPQTTNFIQATNHFYRYATKDEQNRLQAVATFAPGVLGLTGLESAEIIKGVVKQIKPQFIIVIDSLASASLARINTTIQLTDSGISPGSGVANHRYAINPETMELPVIAIGVPTVVNAATIISETLTELFNSLPPSTNLKQENYQEPIIEQLLSPFTEGLIVSPKEIERFIPHMAKLLAAGITQALHPGADSNNYYLYM